MNNNREQPVSAAGRGSERGGGGRGRQCLQRMQGSHDGRTLNRHIACVCVCATRAAKGSPTERLRGLMPSCWRLQWNRLKDTRRDRKLVVSGGPRPQPRIPSSHLSD